MDMKTTVELQTEDDKSAGVFLRTLCSLETEGPADWAENLEYYVEGKHIREGL